MTRSISMFGIVAMSAAIFVAGCTVGTTTKALKVSVAAKGDAEAKSQDPEVQTNLAKLSPADRKLAEAQKWCAVNDENLLGGMGVPRKVVVKGEPVFLCCGSCKKTALADPDKTLAKVAALRTKAAEGAK